MMLTSRTFLLVSLVFSTATLAACPPYLKHDPGGDYTSSDDRAGLPVVEQYHFNKGVENLVKGMTGSLGGDISYTLEHFPNHHRALSSMARLALRDKTVQPIGARYTVSCYFERAIAYAPHDATARMVFGNYLLAGKQDAAALAQLRAAAELAPEHATIQYNLGLLYARQKDYPQAMQYAEKAYALGFPLPGLRNQLKKAGHWREPATSPDAAE
ncbi:tetratricopeptide repeat protein [Janthinobacterium aquaticum]|uniref:tetratricopeptide repeat protein n=1 Tax=Janthinobacterium sp. FT58W TaxID=2654254 RepID=UPI00186B00FE|nr:tetratricopeptide repeat protein [Janthinobacterium sp. FT58W]